MPKLFNILKIKSSLLIIGSLFLSSLNAQELEQKIAIIDINIIYRELPSYKKIAEIAKLKKQEISVRLEKIQDDNKYLLDDFEENRQLRSQIGIDESAKEELNKKENRLIEQIQQIQLKLKQEQHRMSAAQASYISNLITKDKQELKVKLIQLAKQEGFELLLDKSTRVGDRLLINYHADRLDQTDFFLSLIVTN